MIGYHFLSLKDMTDAEFMVTSENALKKTPCIEPDRGGDEGTDYQSEADGNAEE